MPSKDPVQRFEDILHNIDLIEEFTAGMPSRRTPKRLTRPKVRALGNLLRDEYDTVDVIRVWLTVENDLPPLKEAVKMALKRHLGQPEGHEDQAVGPSVPTPHRSEY